MKFRIGVIIVNFRTPGLVKAAIDTLEAQILEQNAVVVIVDNASEDGSAQAIGADISSRAQPERFHLVRAAKNGGFSYGNNRGLEAVNCEYVLFLNSDARVRPGALAAMAAVLDENSSAAAVTPKIFGSDGKPAVSRFRNHTPLSEFVAAAHIGPLTRLFKSSETSIFPNDTATQPEWASFAAFMVRRSVIDEIGGMDEEFFLYYEDCDYCRRIRNAGYSIQYSDKAEFVHDPGGSTKLAETSELKRRLPAYYFRSRSRYYRKYFGVFGPLLANSAWTVGRCLSLLRPVFGKSAPVLSQNYRSDIWIDWRRGDGRGVGADVSSERPQQ